MAHLERTSSRGRRNKTADNTLRAELGAETLVSELDFESLKTFCITALINNYRHDSPERRASLDERHRRVVLEQRFVRKHSPPQVGSICRCWVGVGEQPGKHNASGRVATRR